MTRNKKRWTVLILITLSTGVASIGCGPKMTQIEMDPLEFAAFRTPEGMQVQAVDPELLFKEGASAFKAENYDLSTRYFAMVARKFPDSEFARPALYNFAMSSLRSGRPADAATAFREFISRWPDDRDMLQIRCRYVESLLDAGEWKQAENVVMEALKDKDISVPARLELLAGLAKSLRKQGRLRESRNTVDQALQLYDANVTDPDIKGNYHAAMSSFEGGEVWHDLFLGIKLVLPKDRMEKDLTDKGAMFLKAQSEYMRTVRIGNIFWAARAGVRIGRLYEEFYEDIMNAQVPPELTGQDLELYMAELRSQAGPMLKKAVELYERNMKVSRSYGAKEEWFTDMKARLTKLKKLLREASPAN